MQSGTLLHLALLRKISHLNPTPHLRDRDKSYNKKRQSAKLFPTNTLGTEQEQLPFMRARAKKSRTVASSEKKYRLVRDREYENLTISAWSIQSLKEDEQSEEKTVKNTQIKLKSKGVSQTKQFKRSRHCSQANNIKRIMLPITPQIQNFIPDYVFKRKRQSPKVSAWRQKKFPLKSTSINYIGQLHTQPQTETITSPLKPPSTKLHTYESFINDMRLKSRKVKY